jgi:hypothetical protein
MKSSPFEPLRSTYEYRLTAPLDPASGFEPAARVVAKKAPRTCRKRGASPLSDRKSQSTVRSSKDQGDSSILLDTRGCNLGVQSSPIQLRNRAHTLFCMPSGPTPACAAVLPIVVLRWLFLQRAGSSKPHCPDRHAGRAFGDPQILL